MPTDLLTHFFDHLRNEGIAEKTVKQYESNISRFSRWFDEQLDGDLPHPRGAGGASGPERASQLDVANFKRLAVTIWKPSTVQQTLIHVGRFMDFCVSRGVIPDNPTKHVDRVTVEVKAPKWLDRNEQNALIRAVRQHGDLRDLTLIMVLLHTGLRIAELSNVKVADVVIGERKGKVIVRHGKDGRRREVPLNVDARRTIARWLADREKDSEFLFGTQRRDQMTTRAIEYVVAKYQEITGIDGLSPHALRHTFGHELAVRRVPQDVIAHLMGHLKADGTPNLQMTARYTLPDDNDLQSAVEEISWV